MPQLDVSTFSSQLVWLISCFILLYYSLSRWLLPCFKKLEKARFEETDGKVKRSSSIEEEAQNLYESIDKRYRAAQQEAQEILRKKIYLAKKEAYKKHRESTLQIEQGLKAFESATAASYKEKIQQVKESQEELCQSLFQKLTRL